MRAIKGLSKQLLVSAFFLLGFARMIFGFVRPLRASVREGGLDSQRDVTRGLIVRLGRRTGASSLRRYTALEMNGVFPFVRLSSVGAQTVPVPLEAFPPSRTERPMLEVSATSPFSLSGALILEPLFSSMGAEMLPFEAMSSGCSCSCGCGTCASCCCGADCNSCSCPTQ